MRRRNQRHVFTEQANNHQPEIKFMAEISDSENTFLGTNICKRERFEKDAVLDLRTHFN